MIGTTPWRWGARTRALWAALFYREDRYSFAEMLRHIADSHEVRTRELVGARVLDDRDDVLRFAAERCRDVPGVAAEFGVFKGDTLRVIAAAVGPDRPAHGFDTFEGLPEDWGTLLEAGTFATPVPRFDEHPNVALEVGLIEETLPAFLGAHDPRFALVHVDCDLYGTTKFILEHALPRMASGAVVVFDEYYGYPTYEEHEYKAWAEATSDADFTATPLACSSHACAFQIERSG